MFLGYVYSWYIRGPYCSTLTTCGLALTDIFSRIPECTEFEFTDQVVDERLKRFRKFIRGHENDDGWLEIAAKTHLLVRLGEPHGKAVQYVAGTGESFTGKRIEHAVRKMRMHGIMAA